MRVDVKNKTKSHKNGEQFANTQSTTLSSTLTFCVRLCVCVQVNWEETIKSECPRTGNRYLVIGTGSIGSALIDTLLLRGETDVSNIFFYFFGQLFRFFLLPRISFECIHWSSLVAIRILPIFHH
jgi:hypothetical protein